MNWRIEQARLAAIDGWIGFGRRWFGGRTMMDDDVRQAGRQAGKQSVAQTVAGTGLAPDRVNNSAKE